LTVLSGGAAVETLSLSGHYTSASLHLTSGSSGCVRIFDPPPVAGWATPHDAVDFSGIVFGARTTLACSENSARVEGTIARTDGPNAARAALLGGYIARTFVASADGHSWTSVLQAPQTVDQQILTHAKT
jgi:hypothetical protein